MGGVLVYDSYSVITGCEKIIDYFADSSPRKVPMDIVFSKAEIKEVTRDFFSEKARERDFACEQEK